MINAAMMRKLNAQMANLNKMGVCDAACQKQRSIKTKKNAMVNAQNAMRNAPINLEAAEKAYYTEAKGYPYYARILVQKGKTKAHKAVKNWNKTVKYDFGLIDNKIDYFKSQYIYKKNVGQLYDSYENKYTTLRENVQNTLNQKKVNDRLGYFYDYNTSVVNSIIFYLKYFYWLFAALCFLLFFWKRQYRQIKFYPFFITIVLMPFILSYLYVFTMTKFRYFVINNIYLIFFTLIIGILILFEMVTLYPFNNESV